MNKERQVICIKSKDNKFIFMLENKEYTSISHMGNVIYSDNIEVYLPFKKIGIEDALNRSIKEDLLIHMRTKNIYYIYPTNSVDLKKHDSFLKNSKPIRACEIDNILINR